RQARALEAELGRDFDARVSVAMRYWRPFTGEAIGEMRAFAPDDIVLLPLYPQYSKTTTGSSLKEWNRLYPANGHNPRVHVVREFFEDGAYVDAVAGAVGAEMSAYTDPSAVDVVFSAHSVPVSVIEAGDPYQKQIERTVDLVWRRGGWPARRHLCYQSKVGPSKWLRPMMREMLESLAASGSKEVLMVPISFVSDHVETLFEINIEHREIAERLGVTFRMVPGLNDQRQFIGALAGLVRSALNRN
ncbi:MAG: ferrochelatase, partial [Bryobacteraceae bacterium]